MEPKLKKRFQLFPSITLLGLITIDNLGPLSNTVDDNQYSVSMNDKYSTLTGALPEDNTLFAHVADGFIGFRLVPYSILVHVITQVAVQLTC